MLKENDAERSKVNTDTWHSAGYTGNGVTVVCIDDRSAPHAHMDYAESPFLDVGSIVGHGTNVAQCVHEMAPGAHVVLVMSTEEGRQWITDHVAEIDVVNVSRSAGKSLAEYGYGFLESLDIPVVCSSGNEHDDRVNFPAAFDWAIAVGAYEHDEKGVTDYSNGGERLDCVAPTDIYVKNSEGRAFDFGGTSAASPSVAGMLACWTEWRKENGDGRPSQQESKQFVHNNCIDIGYSFGSGLFCLPAEIEEPDPQPKPDDDKKEDAEMEQKFSDVPKDFWAFRPITWLKKEGYIGGYPDGTFRPNGTMDRAQFAAVVQPMAKEIENLKAEIKRMKGE